MCGFKLFENGKNVPFLIEDESYEGVKLIGNTVAEDIEAVTGVKPSIMLSAPGESFVLMATIGKSPILDKLERDNKLTLDDIRGKREVYKIIHIEKPFLDNALVKSILVIAGSDKRGTIYGMFCLSKMCGVSPLIYFGDVLPVKRDRIILDIKGEIVSKEPSVTYRGFFINDEWPAFGSWATEKFGDVNAKAYEKIFELLLRLNGNYLWPAMWNSSFSEDGPGTLSCELADKLGVIMGTSHHEPLCRAGVEWQRQYKKYSDDNSWSFLSNAEGITRFWDDGLKRNKDFENVITIGMRGEADSKLLPEDATLKDNIDVIKKAIKVQDDLIKKNVNEDITKVPRMLAIYKEVEDYYFGDETTEGLKDWDELKDVIFLLSDDNHGHVRALPTSDTVSHPGGFGMYYHFDYHGAPVSYEWVNCNRLTKTWQQMSLAYEAGVRKMWIVNVGDLKFNEYPLCFFMDLAYDYEKYGVNAINKIGDYVHDWIDTQFCTATDDQKKDIAKVIEGYTRYNSMRTPETMNENIYNPGLEGDSVRREVQDILDTAEKLNSQLKGEALLAYRSIIYYPAAASLNIVLMCVEAGMNKELAGRGCIYANHLAKAVKERALNDVRYIDEFHEFNGGKWNHMMSSSHVGFRTWDAYNWTYPAVSEVIPIHGPKAVISFRGEKIVNLGDHWQGFAAPRSFGFISPDTKEVLLDLDSRGDVGYSYEITGGESWLICKEPKGRLEISEGRKTVCFCIDRTKIEGKTQAKAKVNISFDDGSSTFTDIIFEADKKLAPDGYESFKPSFEYNNVITVNAENIHENKRMGDAGFEVVDYLGKSGKPAITVFPNAISYSEEKILNKQVPSVKYIICTEKEGSFDLSFKFVMTNPIVKGGRLKFGYSINDEKVIIEHAVGEGYFTDFPCKEWCEAILAHEHVRCVKTYLKKGVNEIIFFAGDAGVVLDKILLVREGVEAVRNYL